MNSNFEKNYSEESFWDKVTKHAKNAGRAVLEPALKMHYAAQDPDTPMWAKSVIYGALGYFIMPLDAIPDILPAGFGDDLGVLMAAIATVAVYVKDEHVQKAQETLNRWFG